MDVGLSVLFLFVLIGRVVTVLGGQDKELLFKNVFIDMKFT